MIVLLFKINLNKMKLIIILLSVLTTNLFAQQKSIEGTIVDSKTMLPLKDVEISILNSEYKTKTGSDGKFLFKGLEEGSYDLLILKPSFKQIKKSITLSNEELNFNIILDENYINLPELLIQSFSLINGEKNRKEAIGSAHYISNTDLNKYNNTNIHQILNKVPGINLQEEDGFGLRPNIGIRGTGIERASKITIMEDGIMMAPAPYSSPAAYYFPTVGRMNSVEILKGSSQIKSGPLTTGGSINFISTPIPEKFRSSILLIGGTNNYRNYHGYAGGTFKNFGVLIEGFNYSSDGFKSLDDNKSTGFNKKDYNIKFNYKGKSSSKVFHETILSLGVTNENSNETYLGLTNEDFKTTPYKRYDASQNDNMKADQERYSIKNYIEFKSGINISSTLYLNKFHRNWYKLQSVVSDNNKLGISSIFKEGNEKAMSIVNGTINSLDDALIMRANNRKYISRGAQVVLNKTFYKNNISHDISISSRLHYDEMDRFQWEDKYKIENKIMRLTSKGIEGTNSNRIQYSNAVANYINYKIKGQKYSLTFGLRNENIVGKREDYGKSDIERLGLDLNTRKNSISVIIPGLGFMYGINNSSKAFLGIHKGFSPPGDKPETKPEESINYELGYRKYTKTTQTEIIAYLSDYSNLLGADLAATGGTGTNELFNAGEALVKGIEFSTSINTINLSSKFKLPIYFNYTFTDAKFSDDFESAFDPWGGDIRTGYYLPYISKHLIGIGAEFKSNSFMVNLDYSYKSNFRTSPGLEMKNSNDIIESFGVLNTALNYNFNENVILKLSVSNLLNKVYAVASRPAGLRPGQPRVIKLGIKLDL